MNRKLIITKQNNVVWTALFENEEIAEIHCAQEESEKQSITLGNIYVGKVKNIVHNIGAAFVEIAEDVECYYSLDENPRPIFTHKIGKKALCVGDELLVQVSKEAVKSKVPTVNSNLNFPGKYAVLTSGDTRIGISSKINKAEKGRLQAIADVYSSDKFGFIIRTNAKEIPEDTLKQEIEHLINKYEALMQTANTRVCFSCLHAAPKSYLTDLRNIYQEGLTDIIVEDKVVYDEIKGYLTEEQPEDLEKLRYYEDKLLPLSKLYSIEKHISDALKEKVWLKSGAYLVIQPTEALTVIDVNTGKCVSKKQDENAYFKINMEAAKEAARQIRLRNLSGIILLDFINLSDLSNQEELLETFRKELRKDPIATTLVDMTQLQLVEVTRKKVRKPLHEILGGLK